MSVLAIDAGTTGVTAVLVDENGALVSRGYREFAQHFPRDGWVEHQPDEIWAAVLGSVQEAISGREPPTALGLTNQRETVVVWERGTGRAVGNAIVWQDRRTSSICERLSDAGHDDLVGLRTGLRLDPYFSGPKFKWLAEHERGIWSDVGSGELVVGTVDSFLIARLTGGREHATDASNASRTLLFDIERGVWDQELCELFDVPLRALPDVRPSWGVIAHTDPEAFLGLRIPIAGVAGDQQAALFGQRCIEPGASKCTYGTGSFVLVNTGSTCSPVGDGLLRTIAWRSPAGVTTYALEGSIFVTGAAVQWLRDGLGMIKDATESATLAAQVPDSGGVVFVPALTGLGAPYWDPHARGLIIGITRGTTRAHIARATLEAIAFEVRDIVDVITDRADVELPALNVDGGAATNDLLCQLQADQLQVPVTRSADAESTALGAAMLAGLGTGLWDDPARLPPSYPVTFLPGERDDRGYANWRRAVERCRGWA